MTPWTPNASRHKAMSYERMKQAEVELKAQENFTAPDSRIMKRAGGGFDPAYTFSLRRGGCAGCWPSASSCAWR